MTAPLDQPNRVGAAVSRLERFAPQFPRLMANDAGQLREVAGKATPAGAALRAPAAAGVRRPIGPQPDGR